MEPIYLLAVAVLAAVLVAVLATVLLRRNPSTPTETDKSDERLRQLEAEIASNREQKALLEGRLAVEEQKGSRLPELEKVVTDRAQVIETLTAAKATAERQGAVSSEALTRVQTALHEVKERLADTERTLNVLRTAKAGLEETLASKTEAVTRLETSQEEIRARLAASEQAGEQAVVRFNAAIGEKSELQSEIARTTAILTEKSAAVDQLAAQLAVATVALTASQKEVNDLGSRVATLQETLDQERKQSGEKLQLLAEAKERMTQEFKVLANDVMKSHGETFSQQNKEQIDTILSPLRDKLTEFQQGLHTSQAESVKERAALAEQIRLLSGNSEKMSMEAASLARALRGEAQTQGAWGEMILASILEVA